MGLHYCELSDGMRPLRSCVRFYKLLLKTEKLIQRGKFGQHCTIEGKFWGCYSALSPQVWLLVNWLVLSSPFLLGTFVPKPTLYIGLLLVSPSVCIIIVVFQP